MLSKLYNYLTILAIFTAIIGLFTIKSKVNTLNYQVEQAVAQITVERESIHILKAELAYLCAPNRIRDLTSNYLDLQSLKTSQMIGDPIFAEGQITKITTNSEVDNQKLINNVKWRYKRTGNNRYIQNVSKK